jgi:uncharacterized repeat protein (TIGR03803 family)
MGIADCFPRAENIKPQTMNTVALATQKTHWNRCTLQSPSLLGAFVLALLPLTSAHAQNYQVLYSFRGGLDGGAPHAAVLRDSAGNIYGTTYEDGAYGNGVVFKITP